MGQGYFISGGQEDLCKDLIFEYRSQGSTQAMLISQAIAFQEEDTANENPKVGATGDLIDQSRQNQYVIRANKRPDIPPFISLGEIK